MSSHSLKHGPQSLSKLTEALKQAGNLVSEPEQFLNNALPKITDIAYDSRHVTEGSAFFCIPGEKTNGNQFIEAALKAGASAIFTEAAPTAAPSAQTTFVLVKNARLALAQAASAFYDHPSEKMRLLAVTGTNGKTTTTHLLEHILATHKLPVGLIGTLGARTSVPSNGGANAGQYIDTKHTTPQASDLQRILFEMHESGVTHVAMEVSSHALALDRVAACDFATAALTNLTQDHLDFHKTMENYFLAKQILFTDLGKSTQKNKTAIVNADDEYAKRFLDSIDKAIKVWTYAWKAPADAYVISASFDFSGTKLELVTPSGPLFLDLKLNGVFNVYNVMAAILMALAEGVPLSTCKSALEAFSGVAGRFESVLANATTTASASKHKQPLCLVDYAHTPDGLENVLKSARALVPADGQLLVVFGCGGDRDSSKRPQMGQIAENLADQLFVTSDNPRSEDPQQIIADILAGIKRIKSVKVDVDRAAAIEEAVRSAGAEDVIVIAGKGHETYQILADRTIDFDDRAVARAALSKHLNKVNSQ
ncbi:MAG: UDP-N-acetylmuramoyl-L-alanyl-D-glutamate--2,6-diaminopimelate ligase [Candidatus Obscuribacterales bacterium]|nr:UDP-N-acetylmuramoyl-L-alanyl-D-glutamate--2,6-diaminopimelate ligase [Candidatus Obscuribacterales bacterium]